MRLKEQQQCTGVNIIYNIYIYVNADLLIFQHQASVQMQRFCHFYKYILVGFSSIHGIRCTAVCTTAVLPMLKRPMLKRVVHVHDLLSRKLKLFHHDCGKKLPVLFSFNTGSHTNVVVGKGRTPAPFAPACNTAERSGIRGMILSLIMPVSGLMMVGPLLRALFSLSLAPSLA